MKRPQAVAILAAMGWAKDPEKRAAQEANLAKGRAKLAKQRSQGTPSPSKRRSQPAQLGEPTPPAKPAKPAAKRKPAAAKPPAKPAAPASQTRKRGFLSGLFGGG